MITPNKIISLDESALGKAGAILKHGKSPISVRKLYEEIGVNFESIDQFLLTLDVLYILDRIDLDPTGRTVTYAG